MTIWRGEGSVQPLGSTVGASAKTISLAGVVSEEISGQLPGSTEVFPHFPGLVR